MSNFAERYRTRRFGLLKSVNRNRDSYMDGILRKVKLGHWGIALALTLLILFGLPWLKTEFWFALLGLTYTFYSQHYLARWPVLSASDTNLLADLLDGLRVKRNLELILVLSGLCFGLLSIWLPIGLAKAGVILCSVYAVHLVMTLVLEWEVGIHHDKGIQ